LTEPAPLGEVASLKILAVNKAGAYLAWDRSEDLFLPWKDVKHAQRNLIKEGKRITVFLFKDPEGRVLASTRLETYLSDEAEGFREGDKVTLVIGDRTDLGVRVVVNHRYWGMVHESDIFTKLTRGETREGFIKALRADHKLSITLSAPGYAKVDDLAQRILDALQRRGGFLPLTDKSPPEEIYALFGISKKVFKQTLGSLYRRQRILLEAAGIRLVSTP
jgi:predicted RNA-binding protein (virulence factor B family)